MKGLHVFPCILFEIMHCRMHISCIILKHIYTSPIPNGYRERFGCQSSPMQARLDISSTIITIALLCINPSVYQSDWLGEDSAYFSPTLAGANT